MKWINKGHEYDELVNKLFGKSMSANKSIWIFGAGEKGHYIRQLLDWYGCFAGYVDNDEQKQLTGKDGAQVLSLSQFLQPEPKGLLVVAVSEKYLVDIVEQLKCVGLEEGVEFCTYTQFINEIFPVISVYCYNLTYTETVQICLTERCTLKCKKCAHGCYNVKMDSEDMTLETAQMSIDVLFAKVDRIRRFILIGGEPFLNKNIDRIIAYAGERYRDKMMEFVITTNGTIMPQESVMELCKKYSAQIHISNYSITLPRLEGQYGKLCKALTENSVSYVLDNKEYLWMDYGFETVNRSGNQEELIQVFDACKTPCREIRGSRLYFCVMARSVSENLNMGVGQEDYLDLNEVTDKKVIEEFLIGCSEKGYLDMCKHCNGVDAYKFPIPVAEQL